jgi:aminopeptidase N
MDEGLTQFVPQYFQNENFKKKDIIHDAYRYTGYVMCSDDNVPMGTPSYAQTNLFIYTVNSYYKPQTMYTVLEDVVGKETMTKILREFVQTWRGKHPHPMDFYNLCSTISGKDLKEFFHSWMYSSDYSDLALVSVDDNKVTIRNIGGLMVPVDLVVSYEDGTIGKEHRTALVWSGGKSEITIEMAKKISTAVVGDAYFPDVDESNNSN